MKKLTLTVLFMVLSASVLAFPLSHFSGNGSSLCDDEEVISHPLR